ncbi:MAG: hypothetical protein H8E38_09715 [SAR324 cluster bacterium]|nr:hypothetical protein [SAR324 cluster bacterium]MBL7034819.1 hypothetical protein [SAR324 cluster bacterium]
MFSRLDLILLLFLGSLLFSVVGGCGTSFNQQNYLACLQMLEQDRQNTRVGKGYSYSSQSFEECRAPARYSTDTD